MFEKTYGNTRFRARFLSNPYTFGDKMYLLRIKIKDFFTRWKLIDTKKYSYQSWEEVKKHIRFQLSEEETTKAREIYNKKGTVRYIFTPTGIGDIVEVEVLETGEKINITSYDW